MRDYEEKSYYEIQLDNKQLILVFLAGVTVCVLVFILGVMVGKGKKEAEMASTSRNQMNSARTQEDDSQPGEIQPAVDGANPQDKGSRRKKEKQQAQAPVSKTVEPMVYEDLDKTDQEVPLTPKAEPPAPAAKSTGEPAKEIAPSSSEPVSTTVSKNGTRYTVQVMATGSKEKADQQLSYLKSKGYTAFMSEELTSGGTSVFKVRVGKFNDSDSAKKIATRLKQDLKMDTWVAVLE